MATEQTSPEKSPGVPSSASSSPGSSTSSPYVDDAGPGFDESTPPPEEPTPEHGALGPLADEWQEQQVGDWLRNAGALAHAAIGVADNDWTMTESDLERIGAPLTRILNRYQPARAVAGYSDPLAVAAGFGLYGWRSALERTQALKLAEGEKAEPTNIRPYEPLTNDEPVVETPDDYVPAAEAIRRARENIGADDAN